MTESERPSTSADGMVARVDVRRAETYRAEAPTEPLTDARRSRRFLRALVTPIGRLRLATQFAVLGALLVGVVVAGSFLALELRLRSTTRERFGTELARTQRTLLRLERRELAGLLWTASLLGEAPALRAAIETDRTESDAANPGHTAMARTTLQRAVEKQLAGLGTDLLLFTDADGHVLAGAERVRQAIAPVAGMSVAGVPAVRRALDPQADVDSANLGVVRLGDAYYSAAAAPVLLDGFTIGSVVVGERVDEAWVRTLHNAFDGEIVARAGTRVIGTTLARDVAAATPAVTDDSARTIALGGEDYVAAALTLGVTQDGERVTLVMLHPVGQSVRELAGAFARDFLLVGLVALVLAAVGAAVGARAVLAPLHAVVERLRAGTRTGVFRRAATPASAPREIRTLAESYGALADALDAERDAVRRRTAELETANDDLTQQVRERVRVERALHEREEQLRQSQKLEALGTLAGGVAHDFNNLLTVISGFTEFALMSVPKDDRAHGDLQQVKDAAHRAGELTTQLLAFGRRQVLQPRVMDLNDSVERIHAMLGRLVGRQLTVEIVTAPDLARVHADPGQVEQVLMNLAINARDAMPDGGMLTIATANVLDANASVTGVALTVRDTGTGMDAATRARIFEPFFTTKEQGKGTGLGLATVYGIVQQSGGTIAVDSTPGAGTTFTVVLPAVAGAGALDDHDASDIAPRGAEVVLLVEDEPQIRLLAARILSEQGYRVIEAADGADALAAADRWQGTIDLVLTDVVMPRMTGREVARRLRLARPEVRVLFMSGHSEDAVALHGDIGGGAAFMRKPFTPDSLARAVRAAIDVEVSNVVG